jgi:hypothetical protein
VGERELVGHGATMGPRCIGIGHIGVLVGAVGVVNVFKKVGLHLELIRSGIGDRER